MMISLPQIITNSRLSCLKTCKRKHQFRYEMGVRPENEAGYFRIGGCFHKGVEVHDARSPHENPLAARNVAIDEATQQYETVHPSWNDERVYDWMIEREIVANMLAGYFWRWAAPNNIIKRTIATELPFQIPIRNPESGASTPNFVLAGKIDGIVELQDGRLAIHEIKTTGDDIAVGSDYWSRLRIDSQISTYFYAAKELGHNVQTILYDVAKKPAIRPSQVPLLDDQGVKIVLDAAGQRVKTKDGKKWRESGDAAQGYTLQTRPETPAEFGSRFLSDITTRPDHYFQRQEIPRLDADIAEFEQEIWDQQLDLRQTQRTGRWYRNTSACVGFGVCEYAQLCWNGITVTREQPPSGFVAVSDLHPELKAA